LVSDELTNGQAVMHYNEHYLTASVVYVTTLTYASANDQWDCPACPMVSPSKTKACQFNSVQLRMSSVRALIKRRRNDDRFCHPDDDVQQLTYTGNAT